jgi:putative two-component system response regulator
MKGRILVADDLEPNRELLTTVLTREGHTVVCVADGVAALDEIARQAPDVIVTDVMMPEMNGFELCRRVKENPETRLLPVVIVTSLAAREDRIAGIDVGADDFLTKPIDPHELRARVRSLLRLKRFTDDLESAESVILSLATTVEARDRYTAGHCQRMARYAEAFGAALGLPDDDLAALRRGGFLHDVGKIAVPDAILGKPGPLDAAERTAIQQHATIGDALCGDLRSLRPVRPIVRHHHERFDGGGYPDGLRGEAIPLLAQIMSIVDIYDALTTDRPYRAALPQEHACEELRAEAARGWRNPALVGKFIDLWRGGGLKAP